MAWSSLVENLYYCLLRHISTTCSNATEVTQWAAPSFNLPQPATDNGVPGWPLSPGRYPSRTGLSPTLHRAVPIERHLRMQVCATNEECSQWDIIPGP